jgi:sporulation protein YlmC with PRC-barrel domain
MPDNDKTNGNKHVIAASDVTGTNVYDLSGEKLGSIDDIIINKATGTAEYAIMNFGGLFGIGEKYHPLPWHVLRYDPERGGYVVDLDRDRLEGAPAYDSSSDPRWSDDGLAGQIDAYYGTPMPGSPGAAVPPGGRI